MELYSRTGIKFINNMEETKEQLIEAFKKNNKARREIIAKAKGYANAAEYLLSIYEGKASKKKLKIAPRKAPGAKVVEASKEVKKELVDYIVAFDTTGSMNSYIGDVKKHVESIIPDLFSNDVDLRMQIIAFGDYCDMRYVEQHGNAYQKSDFTDDQSKLITFVKGAKSTSGGDEDEFYEFVIKKIVEETPWREDSKKSVLFIADCNPHKPGYSYAGIIYQIDWKEEAKKAAAKGIAFDTLSIHGKKYPWYEELANITGGVYMPFQSSGKMSEVVSATAYSRSGDKMSKAKFKKAFAGATASGDEELIGTYKSLSKLMD